MRKRPIALFIFSICMMGVALSFPIQVTYLQDFESMFKMLTVLNIIVMVLCAVTSAAVFKLHKSFRVLLPITVVAVIFNNWWVGYVGFNFEPLQTSFASLMFIGLCSVLLEKSTYRVLANPKLKWWDVPKRSKITVPVTLTPLVRGLPLSKKSFDISETGFFMQGLEPKELEQFNVGEKFVVCINFSKILKVRCEAKVVRKSTKKGIYPTGVGLQFEEIDERVRTAIRTLSQAESSALQ